MSKRRGKNPHAKEVRSPKYRMRVVPDKKRQSKSKPPKKDIDKELEID